MGAGPAAVPEVGGRAGPAGHGALGNRAAGGVGRSPPSSRCRFIVVLVTPRTRLALSLGMSACLVGPAPGALARSVPPAGTATQLALPDDTLDVSPDGATLLIRKSVDTACVVPLSLPDDDSPCVTIPGRAGQGVVSPDGARVVLADRAGGTPVP